MHYPLWLLPAIGAAIILLALWARAGDPGTWYSMADIVLGLLLVLAGLHSTPASPARC